MKQGLEKERGLLSSVAASRWGFHALRQEKGLGRGDEVIPKRLRLGPSQAQAQEERHRPSSNGPWCPYASL